MNQFFNSLFTYLFFIFILLAVAGLINPRWVAFWSRAKRTRVWATIIYAVLAIVSLLLTALFPI